MLAFERCMYLADHVTGRRTALIQLLPSQNLIIRIWQQDQQNQPVYFAAPLFLTICISSCFSSSAAYSTIQSAVNTTPIKTRLLLIMALTILPKEVLEDIVEYSLPEGFDSLMLTCRLFRGLCIPFVEEHNKLRQKYQKFRYRELEDPGPGRTPRRAWDIEEDDPLRPVRTAFDLIKRIAIDPKLAHYIEEVDLVRDSWPVRARLRQIVPEVHLGGSLVTLFASSPYFRKAGLDWKEYYATIKEDLNRPNDYSQHAAVFLLTLLPNLKALVLPRMWKPQDATNKLLDIITYEANKSHLLPYAPSLARLKRFGSPRRWEEGLDLETSSHFIALPQIERFHGAGFARLSGGQIKNPSYGPHIHLGKMLRAIKLSRCCLDDVDITYLLKHTPCLKSLFYTHSTQTPDSRQSWDICKFVSATEREVGSHLVELSVSIGDMASTITPGRVSMRGFHALRKLQLPLEIAMCVTGCEISPSAVLPVGDSMLDEGPFLSDLVSTSVAELVLEANANSTIRKTLFDIHKQSAFEGLFRQFTKHKESKMPNLRRIQLSQLGAAYKSYKDQCNTLLVDTEKEGVLLDLVFSTAEIEWEE